MSGFTLGLDLSLTSTGWATWNDDGTFETGTIRTAASEPMGHRLNTIATQVLRMVLDYPALVVIEDQVMRSQAAALSGQVHGAVNLALYRLVSCPPVVRLPPATLKKLATGKGNADKMAMLAAAAARLGYLGHQGDEVDALWLAVAGAHLAGLPSAPSLPKAQLAALDAVRMAVAG